MVQYLSCKGYKAFERRGMHFMRARSGYGLLLVLLLLLLAACGGGSTAPDAHQLITKAQAAIQKVTSYDFNLKCVNIGANVALPITSADGDIKVPDRLKATANALFAGNNVQVQLIAIGSQQYINVFGGWQSTTGLLDPRTLSDQQTGVAAILGHIQNPGTPSDSSVGGRRCWDIKRNLDPSYLAGITGGPPAATPPNRL